MNSSPQRPAEWYHGKMYDALFDAWRSTKTGHRVENGDGSQPKQTRELAVYLWPMELLHRQIAKRMDTNRINWKKSTGRNA